VEKVLSQNTVKYEFADRTLYWCDKFLCFALFLVELGVGIAKHCKKGALHICLYFICWFVNGNLWLTVSSYDNQPCLFSGQVASILKQTKHLAQDCCLSVKSAWEIVRLTPTSSRILSKLPKDTTAFVAWVLILNRSLLSKEMNTQSSKRINKECGSKMFWFRKWGSVSKRLFANVFAPCVEPCFFTDGHYREHHWRCRTARDDFYGLGRPGRHGWGQAGSMPVWSEIYDEPNLQIKRPSSYKKAGLGNSLSRISVTSLQRRT